MPRKSLTPRETSPLVSVFIFSTSTSRSSRWRALNSSSTCSSKAVDALRFDLPLLARENRFVPMTTPFSDGEAFSDASLTSPAFSPNMARSSFSSGVGSLSPLGVILPIMMSPGITCAPTRMMPRSSRSLVASSLTLGMSAVSSSMPRLVSRTSSGYSSTWTEVSISSRTMRSLSTIASS